MELVQVRVQWRVFLPQASAAIILVWDYGILETVKLMDADHDGRAA
jgi:hypothetical protein